MQRSRGLGESLLVNAILEFDEFDSVTTLRRQKAMLPQKFQAEPDDTPQMRQHKQEQLRLAQREIDVRIRRARSKEKFKNDTGEESPDENDQEGNNQNQNNNRGGPQWK